MADTVEEQLLEWQELEERCTHCDTMKPLIPLEAQWLDDYRAHFVVETK